MAYHLPEETKGNHKKTSIRIAGDLVKIVTGYNLSIRLECYRNLSLLDNLTNCFPKIHYNGVLSSVPRYSK